MAQIHLRKYGEAATVNFDLFEVDGVDFRVDATFAAGDVKIMKDEGAEASTTNLPADEGQGYSIALTATEMQAERVVLYLVDQTATKVWLDRTVIIETYGHASAQHALDLDTSMDGLVDKVWDELRSGHTAAGSFGEGVKAEALNAQAKADVNAELDGALNTAIPGSPTAGSVNERLVALDDNYTAARASNLDNLDAAISSRGTADAGDAMALTAGALSNVNAEVVDALFTDTIAELAADPGATPTIAKALMLIYMALRNQATATSSQRTIKNNAGATILTASLTDSAGTFTKGKFA